jgi:hypothetical protein
MAAIPGSEVGNNMGIRIGPGSVVFVKPGVKPSEKTV